MFEPLWKLLGLGSESAGVPPVIGISGGNADSASVRAMVTQIQSAGAIPIFLGNHANRNAKADLEKIDALVVMGNNADIDPERYGQQKHPSTNPESATPEGKARAEYEYEIMQHAIAQKMPLLGVCGGMQRLNVMMGGTLTQDLPSILGHNDHAQQEHNIAPFTPVELVMIEQGTTLSDISGNVSALYAPAHAKTPLPAIMENSMHHQAVDKIGGGLRICAYAREKNAAIPEAIEADPNGKFGGQFMLGVQWHPEFSASPLGKFIAERVVKEAQDYAKAANRTHPFQQAGEENIKSALPMVKPSQNPQVAPGGMTEMILRQRNLAGTGSQIAL